MHDDTFTISEDEVRGFCDDIYGQLGVSSEEINVLTECLLDASLRGIDTHGILLSHIYGQRIQSGQIIPGRHLELIRESPTTALGDAQQGIGQVVSREAMVLAIDKAKSQGMGAVTVFNASHNGAISYYAMMASQQGLIGIVFGNSTPRVAPYGGREGLHGTNPVAYAVPSGDRHPIVLDFATATSGAAIRQAVEDELPEIPEGLALDPDGNPTVDPRLAFDGWLLPKAGPIGYGLGLLADVLIGGLAGAACGKDVPPVHDVTSPYSCGAFMLALDPDVFIGREQFEERVRFLIESAASIAPMEGFDRVRLPGERGFEEKEKRRATGIPIARRSWTQMLDGLLACGLDISLWNKNL
ncbi:MAG: Ldh family oxidoreductase [Candidatus Latescibacteria bacterium]|jgi:LDH2 family malate/lactate/ureidoglycolate dehydrogenase|nr:Ldh family oxidoreductase [Candidatus Latescibacterota bacterium]